MIKKLAMAALKIQSVFRGFRMRKKIDDKKTATLVGSAIRIQTVFRGYKARKKIRNNLLLVRSAIKIQSHYKGYKVRKALINENKKRMRAAILIQSCIRAYKVRKALKEDNQRRIRAVILIQSCIRGYKSRKRLKEIKKTTSAALMIQSCFKRFKKRKLALIEKQKEENAAIQIQKVYKGFKTRKDKKEMETLMFAVIKIQSSYRSYKRRKELEKDQKAALQIQRVYRCFRTKESTEDITRSAILIQGAFRGFKARKKARLEREQILKEIRIVSKTKEVEVEQRDKIDVSSRRMTLKETSSFDERFNLSESKLPQRRRSAAPGYSLPIVDERETVKKSRAQIIALQNKELFNIVPPIEENPSQELFRHPGDVVAAAITLQRFFRHIKERKELYGSTRRNTRHRQRHAIRKKRHSGTSSSSEEGVQHHESESESSVTESKSALIHKKPSSLSSSSSEEAIKKGIYSSSESSSYYAKKEMSHKSSSDTEEELPDLEDSDVEKSAIKIQAVFKGFKTRKAIHNDKKEMENAAIKIQCAYKGHKARENLQKEKAEMVDAAIAIQSVYKGFKARKVLEESIKEKERVVQCKDAKKPSIVITDRSIEKNDAIDEKQIRSALKKGGIPAKDITIKGEYKEPVTPASSIDFDHMPPVTSSGKNYPPPSPPSNGRKLSFGTSNQRFKMEQVKRDFGVVGTHRNVGKSPLPARSSKLKEVSIPTVPTSNTSNLPQQQVKPKDYESEASAEANTLPQQSMTFQGIMRQASITNFFKKGSPTTPDSPDVEGKKKSISNVLKEMNVIPAKINEEVSSKQTSSSNNSSKKQNFFSFFKRSDKNKKEATPEQAFSHPTSNVEFKFSESVKNQKPREEAKPTNIQESNNISAHEKKAPFPNKTEDQDANNLKEDLIHNVLTAVEKNWLSQAPQPTLDKVASLMDKQASAMKQESESDSEESSRTLAQTSTGRKEDDEEEVGLFRQESGSEDLPYLETTLPQEKSGVITITPAAKRPQECMLASISRPRSSSSPRFGSNMRSISIAVPTPPVVPDSRGVDESTMIKVKLPGDPNRAGRFARTRQRSVESYISSTLPRRTNWVNCEDIPDKLRTVRHYASREDIEMPRIIPREECDCDCHGDTHSLSCSSNSSYSTVKPIKKTTSFSSRDQGLATVRPSSTRSLPRPPKREPPPPPPKRKTQGPPQSSKKK